MLILLLLELREISLMHLIAAAAGAERTAVSIA